MEQSKSLRWLTVVLMRLWYTIRKAEMAIVNAIAEWQLDQFFIWKHIFHFTPKSFIHSIIIISIKKSALHQICT